MIRRILLALLFLTLAPSPALAWWEYGHESVATVAMHEVKPQTRLEILRLLRHSALLETPTCPARTIEQASVWADCIKTLKDRFSYAYSWHYMDADVCKPFDPTPSCKDGNCVTAQIERNARLLKDRKLPLRERVMALAFLVHFVGDLHQPFHVGDRGDQGGNGFKVDYGAIKNSNIHTIWDGYLADRGISQPPAGPRAILAAVPAAERVAISQGKVEDWARESWQIAHDDGYGALLRDACDPIPARRPVMDEATVERLVPVVRRQIASGGIRLARLLDEALG